jgi:hypothetical protein
MRCSNISCSRCFAGVHLTVHDCHSSRLVRSSEDTSASGIDTFTESMLSYIMLYMNACEEFGTARALQMLHHSIISKQTRCGIYWCLFSIYDFFPRQPRLGL